MRLVGPGQRPMPRLPRFECHPMRTWTWEFFFFAHRDACVANINTAKAGARRRSGIAPPPLGGIRSGDASEQLVESRVGLCRVVIGESLPPTLYGSGRDLVEHGSEPLASLLRVEPDKT